MEFGDENEDENENKLSPVRPVYGPNIKPKFKRNNKTPALRKLRIFISEKSHLIRYKTYKCREFGAIIIIYVYKTKTAV